VPANKASLYLHWWDYSANIPEIMDSLHILVEQGKVLYLGIADAPAWVASAANEYAIARGKSPFVVYQGRWNLMLRDLERDIIPMARYYGMAIAPWDVLGGGRFQTRKAIEERKKTGEGLRTFIAGPEQSEQERKISDALEEVAKELSIDSITAVALAYVMSKTPNVFPIVGGRKVEHLKDNIQALSIKLTQKQIDKLEEASPFVPGFPGDVSTPIGEPNHLADVTQLIGEDPRVVGFENTAAVLRGSAPQVYVKDSRAIGRE
jgi:aryl-alcohol dehydrogenase-like predicted oxidoreductase